MNEISEHAFTLVVDIVKLDPDSDRVIVNGCLGEALEAKFLGDRFILVGDEALISISINEDELEEILEGIKLERMVHII